MRFAIHGATGAQGSPLCDLLAADGHEVLALSRTGTAGGRGQPRAASLDDPNQLADAYAAVDGVFVHLPIPKDPSDPARWIHNVQQAVAQSKPARVVLSTSGGSIRKAGPHPMLQGKLLGNQELARLIEATDTALTVVAPRLFFENLLLPPVVARISSEGVLGYPLAADTEVSWCSHRDVAEAAADALTRPPESRVVDVGLDLPLTGPDLATALSRHLGRTVVYEAQAPADFASAIASIIGESAAAAVQTFYEAAADDPTLSLPGSGSADDNWPARSATEWLASGALTNS
jgi:NAD(P)H dehydrogenase (quinone)